jgi:glutaminyl-peptide cyclotransferase
VVALIVQLALGGALIYFAVAGFPFVHETSDRADRFDGPRAFRLVREQVELGPRPAGSPASRRLADRLRRLLPSGRFEAVPGGLRNVVGRLPGRRPAIVIAAHYDTKDLPGFVGANDGAGGTAAVVELARTLGRGHRASDPELRFVLFDGEESPRGSPDSAFLRDGLRGSKAYAARHHDVRAVILLDFVANPRLRLRRDDSSDPALWGRLRSAARRAGVAGTFPPGTDATVYDDHTPFLQRGIAAIDLIDFDYACFHRACDDLRHVSARSLDAAGEAVAEMVRRLH